MTTAGSGVAVLLPRNLADNSTVCVELLPKLFLFLLTILSQEAKYVERWPNTTSAWAGWSRFDIPVDRYGGAFPANLHQQSTGVFYLPPG
jgi:hypothetical protein